MFISSEGHPSLSKNVSLHGPLGLLARVCIIHELFISYRTLSSKFNPDPTPPFIFT